jgi:hypothetical protein
MAVAIDRDSSGSAIFGLVRVSMRAVFLNQRDLLIVRGARPAVGLRWVGDGGSGVRQGRIAVSLGSESGARDCVNTAPISSLIDVNTAVVPPSAGGVATGGDAVLDVGGTQRLEVYRERFETAHPHASCCSRSISPILSGELRACCSAAVPSSWT